ncbi:MAG: stalk domain-containing protein, partial [Ruminiclostridium sp.]
GNQTAYINYTGSGDPFNDSSANDNLITLNTSPKKVANEVLVPLKAVIDAIGMKADWNTKTNLVAVQDSMIVKNPILYNALKDTLAYKGELSSSLRMSMKESNSNEDFSIFFTMNSAVNGLNSASNSKFSVKVTGMPDQTFEYDTVNIADKIYSKESETGEWSVLDSSEATELGIMYYDVAADRAETQKLLDAYGKMNIIPEGKATLNGEDVLKYQIKMSADILNEFIPADMIESGLGLEDIYNKGLNYKVEIFINSQGQLVKQSVQMSGTMEIEDYNINVNISVETVCTNIGKDIEIVSPVLKP